jgi:hypothetical protein
MKKYQNLQKKMFVIDVETHRKLKLLAVEEGVNIGEIIRKSIDCYATLKKHDSL